MPLEVLAIMVVVGLAIAIGAVHFSGLSHAAQIEGSEQAGERFRQDFPQIGVSAGLITKDRRAAFLQLDSGTVGLVATMGDRYITRQIDAAALSSVNRRGANGLELHYHDFTYPAAVYEFADASDADQLAGWLEEIRP